MSLEHSSHHEADSHTLVLLPHDGEILRPDANDIQSVLSQNPASLADRQDCITAVRPQVAQHTQQTGLYRYDNRLVGTYTGSSTSEQATQSDSPSIHSRFLHSHSHLNDDGLSKLATRNQQHTKTRCDSTVSKCCASIAETVLRSWPMIR